MITGLGGSYGKEKLYIYKMLPKMGPPNIKELYLARGYFLEK